MSELLFRRRYRALFAYTKPGAFGDPGTNAVEVTNLRCTFTIVKTLTKQPNTLELSIYNLRKDLRAALVRRDLRVVLEAGYDDHIAGVFVGDARTVDHMHEGTEWVTRVRCGDGERVLNLGTASGSFAAGTPYGDVVKQVTGPLGLGDADVAGFVGKKFHTGYAAHGQAYDVIDQVVTAAGLEWSVQDGRIQILAKGGHTTEAALELSAATGLLGAPEFCAPDQKTGIANLKFTCLMSARVRCGGRVKLDSLQHKGVFRVVKVTHKGDTHGGSKSWTTEAECLAV